MSSAGALLLAPGAGADRNHHTLCAVADAMSPLPVERMDFPARKAGRKGVDRAPVAIAAVVSEATELVSVQSCLMHQPPCLYCSSCWIITKF